jgi:hypothetical protein
LQFFLHLTVNFDGTKFKSYTLIWSDMYSVCDIGYIHQTTDGWIINFDNILAIKKEFSVQIPRLNTVELNEEKILAWKKKNEYAFNDYAFDNDDNEGHVNEEHVNEEHVNEEQSDSEESDSYDDSDDE